jgi:hypothetical protein
MSVTNKASVPMDQLMVTPLLSLFLNLVRWLLERWFLLKNCIIIDSGVF